MKISDQQLSAFLDAELPEQEMETIRQRLNEDESLANRLAELANIDGIIASNYSAIDSKPVPEAIQSLLQQEASDSPKDSKVVSLSLWQRAKQGMQQHVAIAASAALIAGYGIAQLMPLSEQNSWTDIAAVLDTTPSGIMQQLDNNTSVKPQLTFMNQQEDYCRQFEMIHNNRRSENIACRQQQQWQITATIYQSAITTQQGYQTASGGSVLDSAIDQMLQGQVFDASQESAAIDNQWSEPKKP